MGDRSQETFLLLYSHLNNGLYYHMMASFATKTRLYDTGNSSMPFKRNYLPEQKLITTLLPFVVLRCARWHIISFKTTGPKR